jgi:hypothetical protein
VLWLNSPAWAPWDWSMWCYNRLVHVQYNLKMLETLGLAWSWLVNPGMNQAELPLHCAIMEVSKAVLSWGEMSCFEMRCFWKQKTPGLVWLCKLSHFWRDEVLWVAVLLLLVSQPFSCPAEPIISMECKCSLRCWWLYCCCWCLSLIAAVGASALLLVLVPQP